MNTMNRIRARITGKAQATITPKLKSRRSMQKMPPTKNTRLRMKPRISWLTRFCSWVMSLEIRVIRDPVEN